MAGYMLTNVCLLAIYMGNLTASLAIKHQPWPLTTITDFAESNFNLYLGKGTHIEQVLLGETHRTIMRFKTALHPFKDW